MHKNCPMVLEEILWCIVYTRSNHTVTDLLGHGIKVVSSRLTDSLDYLKPHPLFPVVKPLMEPQGGVLPQMGVVDKKVLGISDTFHSNPRAHIVKPDKTHKIIKTVVKCSYSVHVAG